MALCLVWERLEQVPTHRMAVQAKPWKVRKRTLSCADEAQFGADQGCLQFAVLPCLLLHTYITFESLNAWKCMCVMCILLRSMCTCTNTFCAPSSRSERLYSGPFDLARGNFHRWARLKPPSRPLKPMRCRLDQMFFGPSRTLTISRSASRSAHPAPKQISLRVQNKSQKYHRKVLQSNTAGKRKRQACLQKLPAANTCRRKKQKPTVPSLLKFLVRAFPIQPNSPPLIPARRKTRVCDN